ncbi:hypothetical protein FQA39_LY13760 [Lamprigera yunnana]|nr:hypothetical protein FQA39_LY13760 [Lamprigera yunnana]
MKVLLLIVCICIGVSQQINFDKVIDDFEDVIDKEAKECYDEFKLNRTQLDSMVKMENLPNDRNLKCYIACILIHVNIVDESFNVLTENAKKYYELDEPSADLIYNKCRVLKGEDNCEKAFTASNCVRENLKNL